MARSSAVQLENGFPLVGFHGTSLLHALSFDVEGWYDTNLGAPLVAERTLPGAAERLRGEWTRVLHLLGERKVTATFFVLGDVAEQHSDLVEATARAGHEIASHSYHHRLVRGLPLDDLAAAVKRTRDLLKDLSGQEVLGFRAPSWSLSREDVAALQIIAQSGHVYSSSVFPASTPLYGDSDASNRPYEHALPAGYRLLELPPAVAKLGSARVPFGGGIYFRMLPLLAVRALITTSTASRIIYLHPWELNPDRAMTGGVTSRLARFVLTYGVGHAYAKLEHLLNRTHFASIREAFAPDLERFCRGEELVAR